MIKTIFFDIGGVLINIYPNKFFENIGVLLSLPSTEIKKYFSKKDHDLYETGKISSNRFYKLFNSRLPKKKKINEDDFWSSWDLILGEEKRTIRIIEKLKLKYPIWLLSNTNSKHLNNKTRERYNFPNIVDGYIYSYEAGFRKPNNDIYIYAAKKVNTKPVNCIFIDDLIENVYIAKKNGFNAIHYKNYDNLIFELKLFNINL